MKHIVWGICLLLGTAVGATAQTAGTGTIIGTATDPSGAVVPAAKIELQDVATKIVRSAVSNSAGQYSFVGLQPGTYSVRASHTGFQELIVPQFAVEVGRSYTINLEFRLGATQNVVEVTSTSIGTQAETIDRLLAQERIIAQLAGFIGLLALLLACTGLFGLLSHEVGTRTREIGIRMALGARRGDVLRLVLGTGLVVATFGLALGASAAFGVTRYLRSILFDVQPADPITFIAVGALLLCVALLACYLPARRAATVDPLNALRAE